MAKRKPKDSENEPELEDETSKVTQIILAGLLMKSEPKPDLHRLEELIKIRHGTLSALFPQRRTQKRQSGTKAQQPTHQGEKNAKEEGN